MILTENSYRVFDAKCCLLIWCLKNIFACIAVALLRWNKISKVVKSSGKYGCFFILVWSCKPSQLITPTSSKKKKKKAPCYAVWYIICKSFQCICFAYVRCQNSMGYRQEYTPFFKKIWVFFWAGKKTQVLKLKTCQMSWFNSLQCLYLALTSSF